MGHTESSSLLKHAEAQCFHFPSEAPSPSSPKERYFFFFPANIEPPKARKIKPIFTFQQNLRNIFSGICLPSTASPLGYNRNWAQRHKTGPEQHPLRGHTEITAFLWFLFYGGHESNGVFYCSTAVFTRHGALFGGVSEDNMKSWNVRQHLNESVMTFHFSLNYLDYCSS